MVRRFSVSAKSKGRMRVNIETLIVTEPCTLTKGELASMKTVLADKIMVALSELRYLNVNLSEIKVSR